MVFDPKGWRQLSREEAASRWDAMLARFTDASPFQTFSHGSAAEHEGWSAQYWIHAVDGAVSSMVLLFVRTLPLGTGMFWVVGGPAGDLSDFDSEFLRVVTKTNGFRRAYLRMRIDREDSSEGSGALKAAGLRRPIFGLTSGMTVELDLSGNVFESTLSKNWRRAVKKAEKEGLVVSHWERPDPSVLGKMLESLENRKGVSVHFPSERIENCIANLGDVFRVYKCEDGDGNIVAFRGSLVFSQRAIDFVAATGESGLNKGASQYLVAEMARSLASEGIGRYELGGIDADRNPGVTRFKVESGGRVVRQTGEWDIATSRVLRLAANVAIKLRQFMQNRPRRGKAEALKLSRRRPANVPHVA